MKKAVWLVVLAAALVGFAGTARAGELDVDIGFFYDQLAPYGEWITVDPFGPVWCPYDVGPGWRPYWDGDWVYSDWGWTFVSPVDWGWAVYHYGRWGFRDDLGWFWVPGTVWGPSWVAWRYGDGIIGWAPLPPEVGWDFGVGLVWGGLDVDSGIGWSRWSFCDVRRFADRDVRRYIFDPARNVTLLGSTRNETHYSFVDNRIVDDNIDISRLERESGRRIERYTIQEQAGNEKSHAARVRGGELQVFRPRVSGEASRIAPANLPPARRFGGTERDLAARHRKEQAQLSQQQEAERKAMARRHQQEAQAAGQSSQETKARHQQESQALAEHHQTQRQVMENRHQREQENVRSDRGQGGGRPPKKK